MLGEWLNILPYNVWKLYLVDISKIVIYKGNHSFQVQNGLSLAKLLKNFTFFVEYDIRKVGLLFESLTETYWP
jgi:hypothetical protein